MSRLDPRIRTLVDAARATHPTAADRARIRAALATRLVLPVSTGPASPSLPAAAAPAAGLGVKLLAAGALIGATGFGGGLLLGKRSPPPDLARHGIDVPALQRAYVAERRSEIADLTVALAAAPAPAPAAIVARAPIVPVLPRRLPATPPSVPPPIEPATEPASPDTSSLLEETKLLRAAQTSLGAGDAPTALARLDELGARHADGVLREERLAAHIVALCAVGRDQDARREAARFLAEAPLSIHAARVRASCASPPRGAFGQE